jgi:hypothetical protein
MARYQAKYNPQILRMPPTLGRHPDMSGSLQNFETIRWWSSEKPVLALVPQRLSSHFLAFHMVAYRFMV